MNVDAPLRERKAASKIGVVDCDIHPVPRSPSDLDPYLPKRWQEHMRTFGAHLRQAYGSNAMYPRMTAFGMRVDSIPKDGPPGSDLALLREQHLDANDIECGMLIALSRSGMQERNPDLAAALTHAVNEWQLDAFVRPEPRLRAGLVINQDNPEAALAEIEKRAPDRSFVQIIMSTRAAEPLGHRKYWPVYKAAAEAGLPLGLHPAGTANGNASSGGGWPGYYIQEHHSFVSGAESMVTSLVYEGVFEHVPNLKVAIIEGGFGWVPSLCWRMDKHFETFRKELPHLKRKPSEYVRQHFWFATQPAEEPERSEYLTDIIEWIGWNRLMFSSDYPHWDFDDPRYALKIPMTQQQRRMIMRDNAYELYRLP